jgi:hypothetical protein
MSSLLDSFWWNWFSQLQIFDLTINAEKILNTNITMEPYINEFRYNWHHENVGWLKCNRNIIKNGITVM